MRIKEFQAYLRKKGIDYALLISFASRPDSSFIYFTQVSGIFGILLIPDKEKPILLASNIEEGIAKKYSIIKNVKAITDFKDIKKYVKGKTVGVNHDFLSRNLESDLRKELKVKFVDVSRKIRELRVIKTKKEVELLKKSCMLADNVMRYAINKASSKITELQLRELIDEKIKDLGVEPSFPAIVASNNDNPHYRPENKKLNGFVVIDLGVKYKNYCSDITRTIYIGKPSKHEIEMYNKVLKIQEDCCKTMEKDARRLDMKARLFLGEHFSHSLGHGIGIDIHEQPALGPNSEDKIKKGMVYTIEPGYYKKFGIRIEDDVLLLDKPAVLTKTMKKLVIRK